MLILARPPRTDSAGATAAYFLLPILIHKIPKLCPYRAPYTCSRSMSRVGILSQQLSATSAGGTACSSTSKQHMIAEVEGVDC